MKNAWLTKSPWSLVVLDRPPIYDNPLAVQPTYQRNNHQSKNLCNHQASWIRQTDFREDIIFNLRVRVNPQQFASVMPHDVFARKLFFIVLVAIKCDAFLFQQQIRGAVLNHRSADLRASTKDTDRDFWAKQKELVSEMQAKSNRNYQQELKEKFAKRRLGLVTDTAYFGFFIFCGAYTVFSSTCF